MNSTDIQARWNPSGYCKRTSQRSGTGDGVAREGRGFNPDQLVARGVFDSMAELDAVMCELDDVRPGPTVTRLGWGLGMDFNRARMGSGVAEASQINVVRDVAEAVRAPRGVQPAALCIFCAWERASQPGPRMARPRFNGDVMLVSCERHSATRPDTQNNPQAAQTQGLSAPSPRSAA